MVRKDAYLNTVMYVLFVILILFGCTMGLQRIGHSVKHVVEVQTYGEAAEVAAVPVVSAPDTQTNTTSKTNTQHAANPPAVQHTVHAKDIIKGKAVSDTKESGKANESARKQAQSSTSEQSNIQNTSKTAVPPSNSQRMTIGEFVERAGLGVGIFVKKETRTAMDGLVRLLEQTNVQ